MKAYNIIGILAAICLLFISTSCVEDKYYDMGGTIQGRVNFMAMNLSTGWPNQAESTRLDKYSYLEDRNAEFDVRYSLPYSYDGSDFPQEVKSISIRKESEIWTGGHNRIEITFIPSTPEEQEATFTMPDGTVCKATLQQPTIYWTPDSTLRDIPFHNAENTFIKAESRYRKGETTFYNVGYIFVAIDSSVCYNPENRKWYFNWWMNEGYDPIFVESYVKFSARNLTIGQGDEGVSYRSMFPQTEVSRNEILTIPYVNSYDENREYQETLTGNDFFICGNNEILFTFLPDSHQKELHLFFPDQSEAVLTKENPTYIWTLSREEVHDIGYRTTIYGRSIYINDGMQFHCWGEISMHAMYEMWYDSESGLFRRGIWW